MSDKSGPSASSVRVSRDRKSSLLQIRFAELTGQACCCFYYTRAESTGEVVLATDKVYVRGSFGVAAEDLHHLTNGEIV